MKRALNVCMSYNPLYQVGGLRDHLFGNYYHYCIYRPRPRVNDSSRLSPPPVSSSSCDNEEEAEREEEIPRRLGRPLSA